MFLSICIPTYNRAHTIERTLESLRIQTCKDFEVIVVDDGSLDDTEIIIEKWKSMNLFPLHYIKKTNGGKHTVLNVGIINASGDFFLILDSDDCLEKHAVDKLVEIVKTNSIMVNSTICGVIAKCATLEEHQIIGDSFDVSMINYIDFHFRHAKRYIDCCECIKTCVMKQYQWPEPEGTRFVPESYVFDQIGMKYDLVCSNEVLEYKEYLVDGITRNVREYRKMNNIGYLYDYVSKLDDIFPNAPRIAIRKKVLYWTLYWNAVSTDYEVKGPRVKKVSTLGFFVKLLFPFLKSRI